MANRDYWVGLPVGITPNQDGSITIEVDMSEASEAMADVFAESDLVDWTEDEMIADGELVDRLVKSGTSFRQTIFPAS